MQEWIQIRHQNEGITYQSSAIVTDVTEFVFLQCHFIVS